MSTSFRKLWGGRAGICDILGKIPPRRWTRQNLHVRDHTRVNVPCSSSLMSTMPIYKFGVSNQHLDTVKATLPLVAEAGTDFTKHFYKRMFAQHSTLLNVFNQTNQVLGGQPKKLLKTVAVAAQAAIDTGELPGEAIEGICQKHAALHISPEAYSIVGENILGTIEDLLTTDKAVLKAWEALYGDIADVFITREAEITEAVASMPNGWKGRRSFILEKKEKLSDVISRFTFRPADSGKVPEFKAGKFTTIWVSLPEGTKGPYGSYQEQPRHYTLAMPQNDYEKENTFSISVKKQGLVSTLLHDTPANGTATFDLSAPFGCFDLSGIEHLWLTEPTTPLVFLSAGVGITPVLAMLENIYITHPSSWLHAAENGSVHAYRDRLREIAAVRSGELQRRVWYNNPLPGDGPPGGDEKTPAMYNLAKYHFRGHMDLVSAHAEQENGGNKEHKFPPQILHLDNSNTQYYMCGPPAFMETQREGLVKLGVDEFRVHWEGF